MAHALVLNATYEPLCVVSQRRAVVLVLTGKAVAVESSDDELHSERLSLRVPLVVRLARFVRVPYRGAVPLTRRAVFARDGGRCVYCLAPATSIDHVTRAAVAAGTSGRTSSPAADAATTRRPTERSPSSAGGCRDNRSRRLGSRGGFSAPGGWRRSGGHTSARMSSTTPKPPRLRVGAMKARVALLGLLPFAVVGCSNSSSGGGDNTAATSPPTTASASASPSESPTESATPTPTPSFSSTVKATHRCRTTDLQLSLGQGQGVAGASVLTIIFTNVGQRPCTLFGYPGVSFLDPSGAQVGVPATHDGGEEATVTLGQNGSANAQLRVPDPGNYSPNDCKSAVSAQIRVYPPGDRTAALLPYLTQVCTTPKAAANVHPVTPGTGA